MKPEQLEITRLRREVTKLKAERRLPPNLGERQATADAPNVLDRTFGSQLQMDCRLHICLDSGRLALRGSRHRPVLPARCRLIDERSADGAARHRCLGDGDLAPGKPDALLHSDCGSHHTSEQFQRLMADNGVICSMSRSGNVWDNAAVRKLTRNSTICSQRAHRFLWVADRAKDVDCISRSAQGRDLASRP